MKTATKAKITRQAAKAAGAGMVLSLVLGCGPAAWAGQHGGGQGHASGAPRSQPHAQPRPQQAQRPAGNGGRQQAPNYPGGSNAGGQNPGGQRPANGSAPYSVRATPNAPGHLPAWLDQHRNLPANQQERLLRQEPGFNRLSPGEQQRQIQQLHQLNQMPEAQRDRRLARAENLERLSPADRMQVNQAARQMTALPPDRQSQVRRAFQDLRGVPIDQRATVLNSARYNANFSPEERNILTNLLRIEPYEPVR